MSKCIKCNVNFSDDSKVCPLCKQILEPIPGEQPSTIYPNITLKHKKTNIALNILGFIFIVAEIAFVAINLTTNRSILWCLVTGAALLYAYLTIGMAFEKSIDLRMRFLFQAISGVVFLLLIDYLFGFHGWSLSIVLPIAILFMDTVVFILMLVNRNSFQSFIWLEILLLALSFLPFISYFLKVDNYIVLRTISLSVSAFLYIGTILIGGKRAIAEMQRRFHL